MAEITCMCDTTFEADLPDSIDLSKDPGLEKAIMDGCFLSFACPKCGSTIKPDVALLVTKPDIDLDVFMVPEKERNRFLLGLTEYEGYKRVVIGFAELVEILTIHNADLDDRAVELLKYYLLAKSGAGTNPTITFVGLENRHLLFRIAGLQADEVGIARIPREVYEKSLLELPMKETEEPYSVFLSYPYVSISKVEIEET